MPQFVEGDLEDFLARNPYLIDRRFEGVRPARQLSRAGNRLDLLFELPSVDAIVELKRGPLDADAVYQLERYVREWSGSRKLGRTHYLVGQPPLDAQDLAATMRNVGFRIRLRLLGREIPLQLIFDLNRKRYVPYTNELAALTGRYGHVQRFVL